MKINKLDIVETILRSGNTMELSAKGNSMYPTIRNGDKILIKKNFSPYLTGDIILYYENNLNEINFVVHRIVKNANNKIFLTKGDNNKISDRPIRQKQILGLVIKILRQEKT